FLVNQSKFELDPKRIALFGTSAGAHLALVAGLGDANDYPLSTPAGERNGKVRAIVSFYGPTSFIHKEVFGANFQRPERFVPLLGGKVEEKMDIARKLSPVELLRKDSPAILLANGDEDTAVPYKNATFLETAAKAKGVTVECIISKGAGHGFKGKSI